MQTLERFFLFVTGDQPERFEKANSSCADSVILDLENAVSSEKKIIARENALNFMSNDEKVLIAVRAKIVITSRLAGSYPSVDGITTEFMKNELTIQNAIHSCKMGVQWQGMYSPSTNFTCKQSIQLFKTRNRVGSPDYATGSISPWSV